MNVFVLASSGEGRVTLDKWPVHQLSTTIHTTGNLERPLNLLTPVLHVFGLWEEAAVPGENPRRHRENMQTPHRNVLT